jgi:class 3 adenylate cyclase
MSGGRARWLGLALVASVASFATVSRAADGPEPVALTPGAESIPLAGHVAALRDETNELTFEQVRSPAVAARFVPSDKDSFSAGWADAAYWYRLELRGAGDWVLEVQNALLDELDLYIAHPDGTVQSFHSGDRRRTAPGQLAHRRFAFPVRTSSGTSLALFIRARTEGRHVVPLQLWSASAFQARTVDENLGWGARFGVLALMTLYHLLLFLWVRDRTYLYYAVALFAGTCFAPIDAGYARLYGNDLFEHAPDWINLAYPTGIGLFTIAWWLFIGAFLQLRKVSPPLYRVQIGMMVMGAGMILCLPLAGYAAAVRFSNQVLWISYPLALLVAVYLAIRGQRMARFFLLAWGLFIASQIWWLLAIRGVLPMNAATIYAPGIALMLGLAVFSIAIADRINGERRERLGAEESTRRLKTFLPQKVAELVGSGDSTLLAPKRHQITVCVIDLRGFTPFSETSAPEDVMSVLREFYEVMGAIVEQHGGTVEHFAGDSMLIFFNAPLEIPEPEKQAVQTALEMRAAFEPLRAKWIKLGHELGLGIGIADGYATIGAIGFSGRSQYAAIGAVTNLASRLCSSAQHGEILTTSRVLAAVESLVESESAGEHTIKGFHRPIQVVRLLGLKNVPGESRLFALEG